MKGTQVHFFRYRIQVGLFPEIFFQVSNGFGNAVEIDIFLGLNLAFFSTPKLAMRGFE